MSNLRNNNITVISQSTSLIKELNVFENILISIKGKNNKSDNIRIINNVLKKVGLEGFGKRKITTLSGGKAQRVTIARALVNKYPATTYLLENKKLALLNDLSFNINEDYNNEFIEKSVRNNIGFQIKSSIKELKQNMLKLSVITMLIVVISSILLFFATLNSFSLKDKYKEFSNKNGLEYLKFLDKSEIKDNNNTYNLKTLFRRKPDISETKYGYPTKSSNDTLFENVIFIDENFNHELLTGNLPTNFNEIIITDYLNDTIFNNLNIGDKVDVLNQELIISGIYQTNYNNKNRNNKVSNLIMNEKYNILVQFICMKMII